MTTPYQIKELQNINADDVGFFDGRRYRISYKYSVPTATPLTIKFTSPCNFVLRTQNLTVDANNILYEAVVGGTPSGTFDTPIPIWGVNRMQELGRQIMPSLVTINTGGTVAGGGIADVISIHTSGGTGTQNTISDAATGMRGLPPGDYYLRMTASGGTATGTLALLWEERPD